MSATRQTGMSALQTLVTLNLYGRVVLREVLHRLLRAGTSAGTSRTPGKGGSVRMRPETPAATYFRFASRDFHRRLTDCLIRELRICEQRFYQDRWGPGA